jgi:hypothetical protein
VTQFAVLKAGTAQTINAAITISLTTTMKLLTRAVSRMPTYQQRGGDDNYRCRRYIHDCASFGPGVLGRIVVKRRRDEAFRETQSKILREADDVTRPANGDRGGAYGIFEDQVPANSRRSIPRASRRRTYMRFR